MTAETFYLFITVYIISTTAIGFIFLVGSLVWAYKVAGQRDKRYQEMKAQFDEQVARVRENLRGK